MIYKVINHEEHEETRSATLLLRVPSCSSWFIKTERNVPLDVALCNTTVKINKTNPIQRNPLCALCGSVANILFSLNDLRRNVAP
jgi:hypothetical protein